jgi:ribosomal protein L32E
MTLQDIAQEMLKEIDKYAVVKETQVPKFVQAKTHKKWRTNKKWKKRYGMKLVYETKRAKVLDVTIDTVIEFCKDHELPLPEEFIGNTTIIKV